MTHLFISDLHLKPERPDLTEAFFSFLKREARSATTLYILGDFFEVWIGDDEHSPLTDSVATALREVALSGVEIFFLPGNRDFLLGGSYAAWAGMKLIQEPHALILADQPCLLMHGDALCTLDQEYQKFRSLVRSPVWQQDFLAKSLAERRAIAQHLRQESQSRGQEKAAYIMDVTEAEVERVMREHQVEVLIHGHTHRPAVHTQPYGTRYVLGDWDTSLWFLRVEAKGIELIEQPI